MRIRSETASMKHLAFIREKFRLDIQVYERNALPCETCRTPGACCKDEHFVNVIVSRLEAAAIRRAVSELPVDQQAQVLLKAATAAAKLEQDPSPSATYACPLYEAAAGCLVHETAKP